MEIDTICMSGGGIKGVSFIGALDYLNNIKYIDITKIKNWVGTSAGALVALLLSCGYTTLEIGDFVIDFDFTKINLDISVDNVFLNYGINNGERFEFILKSFIKNKFNLDDITFAELYKITNNNLLIIGTNFTKCCEEVFSYKTTPNMSVLIAARISCSIPVFFTPVLYNGNYYVDGCIKNNFPIDQCNIKTTLGLYIKHNDMIEEITSIFSIIIGCLGMITDTVTFKDRNSHENVIQIDNYKNEMIKFDLTIENKLKIINLGQIYAKKFIDELPIKISKSILDDIIDNIDNIKNKYKNQETQTDQDYFNNSLAKSDVQVSSDVAVQIIDKPDVLVSSDVAVQIIDKSDVQVSIDELKVD